MNRQQLEVFRQRLLQHKQSVEEDIASLREELAGFNDESRTDFAAANHPADKASDFVERERHMALIDNLGSTLRLANEALERLEAGTYGICQNCGQQISLERLEALPYATLCINCQSRQEHLR